VILVFFAIQTMLSTRESPPLRPPAGPQPESPAPQDRD
jgi:hypothetical protein